MLDGKFKTFHDRQHRSRVYFHLLKTPGLSYNFDQVKRPREKKKILLLLFTIILIIIFLELKCQWLVYYESRS